MCLLLPLLGATAPWPAAPAEAQQIPWIGLSALGSNLVEEVGPGHLGPGSADYFGFAVATGDFNDDGYDDLANGVPGNDCDFVVWDCGAVQVRFGSPLLTLDDGIRLDPAAPGAPEPAEEFDEYGWALASGDFNADGHDDLAVGIPGDWGPRPDGPARLGAVQVHYGLPSAQGGLQAVAGQFFHQPTAPGAWPAADERFGHALAVGDFNGDGHDDLAVGTPRNWRFHIDPSLDFQHGNVHVAHGHAGGLLPLDQFEMALGREGLPDAREAGDEFGWALAAGDFNGDGFDDLAIGVPGEDDVGAVLVVYGSPFSLLFSNHWYFGHLALGGQPQPGSRFGATLTVGDFDADGFDDLAAGAPSYDGEGGAPADFGLVSVVYGSQGGLTPNRVHWLYEHVLFGPGTSEPGDLFGSALAAGDFDGDGFDDLAIGAAGENLEDTATLDTGAVTVVEGRPLTGLTGVARQLRPQWDSQPPGPMIDPVGLIPDHRVGHPEYGSSLAAGDLDGNGFADLAIGAPRRNRYEPTGLVDSGAVAVLFGRLFYDGFESGTVGAWPAAAP